MNSSVPSLEFSGVDTNGPREQGAPQSVQFSQYEVEETSTSSGHTFPDVTPVVARDIIIPPTMTTKDAIIAPAMTTNDIEDPIHTVTLPVPSATDPTEPSKTNKGWTEVFEKFKAADTENIKQMDEYIDTLLVFAGLFSAILTAFLVQLYVQLQPDTTQLTAPVLVDISNQIYQLSLGNTALPTNVSSSQFQVAPETSTVAVTSLWFLSLALSLGAALFGILVKQWLREYMRWTSVAPARRAVYIRNFRKKDIEDWGINGIITILSELLQLGLVLFFVGLAILLWHVHATVAVIVTVIVSITVFAAVIASILPVLYPSCPYRTSLASILLIARSKTLSYFIPDIIRSRTNEFLIKAMGAWRKALKRLRSNHRLADEEGHRHNEASEQFTSVPDSELREFLLQKENRPGFRDWVQWDESKRIPSEDIDISIGIYYLALTDLTDHHAIRDDLVEECLSDLPSPPRGPVESNNSNVRSADARIWSKSNHVEARLYASKIVVESYLQQSDCSGICNAGVVASRSRQLTPRGKKAIHSSASRSSINTRDLMWPGILRWFCSMARDLYKDNHHSEGGSLKRNEAYVPDFLDALMMVLKETEDDLDMIALWSSCYPFLEAVLSNERTKILGSEVVGRAAQDKVFGILELLPRQKRSVIEEVVKDFDVSVVVQLMETAVDYKNLKVLKLVAVFWNLALLVFAASIKNHERFQCSKSLAVYRAAQQKFIGVLEELIIGTGLDYKPSSQACYLLHIYSKNVPEMTPIIKAAIDKRILTKPKDI